MRFGVENQSFSSCIYISLSISFTCRILFGISRVALILFHCKKQPSDRKQEIPPNRIGSETTVENNSLKRLWILLRKQNLGLNEVSATPIQLRIVPKVFVCIYPTLNRKTEVIFATFQQGVRNIYSTSVQKESLREIVKNQ